MVTSRYVTVLKIPHCGCSGQNITIIIITVLLRWGQNTKYLKKKNYRKLNNLILSFILNTQKNQACPTIIRKKNKPRNKTWKAVFGLESRLTWSQDKKLIDKVSGRRLNKRKFICSIIL